MVYVSSLHNFLIPPPMHVPVASAALARLLSSCVLPVLFRYFSFLHYFCYFDYFCYFCYFYYFCYFGFQKKNICQYISILCPIHSCEYISLRIKWFYLGRCRCWRMGTTAVIVCFTEMFRKRQQNFNFGNRICLAVFDICTPAINIISRVHNSTGSGSMKAAWMSAKLPLMAWKTKVFKIKASWQKIIKK